MSRYTDWTSGEPVEKEWTVTGPTDPALRALRDYVFASLTIGATDRHRLLTFIDAACPNRWHERSMPDGNECPDCGQDWGPGESPALAAAEAAPLDVDWSVPVTTGVDADVSAYAAAPLDVERLGFTDLLDIGEALLAHYPPNTIVCSHSVKADIGAQTAAGIADVIASCRAALRSPDTETAP